MQTQIYLTAKLHPNTEQARVGSGQIYPMLHWEGFTCRARSVDELFPDIAHSEVLRQPRWRSKHWDEGAQMTKRQSELLPAGLTGWKLGDPHVHKDAVDWKKCLISREVPASPTTHCSQQSCACPSSHVGCGPRGYGVEAARTRQFLHQQLRAALASLISPKHPPPDTSKWKAPTYKLIKILTMNEKGKKILH